DRPTCAMRPGSDTPSASITIHSGAGSNASTRASASSRPPAIEQQTQPLATRITLSARCASRPASMSTGPKSLTSTAARRSPEASAWFSKVVLPAPRKPPTTVSGMRAMSGRSERQRPAADDGAQHLDVLEPLRRHLQRIVAQHAEIGVLADLDRADQVV
ncbi:hypothetical protein OY671_011734, partial [Metschnikowia pulcherrima]